MYQKAYTKLFNAITDAIEEMDAMNFGRAKQGLIRAQQESEEMFFQAEDKEGV